MKREHAQCLCAVGLVATGLGGIVGLLMLFSYLGDHGVSPVILSCSFLGLVAGLLCLCAVLPAKKERVSLNAYTPTSIPMTVTVLQVPAKAVDVSSTL